MGVLQRERGGWKERVSRLKMIVGEKERFLQPKPLTATRSSPPRSVGDTRPDHGGCWMRVFLFFQVGMPWATFDITDRGMHHFFSLCSLLLSSLLLFFFIFLFFCFFLKNYLKMKINAIKKGLGLALKKCSFKVKSLTMLLCVLGISKRMGVIYFFLRTTKLNFFN